MIEQRVTARWLAEQNYLDCWQAMKTFTDQRTNETVDELWLLEHPPVFTQGQNGKPEHILSAGDIPIIQTDRGGQVTYHGPGQLMLYTLIDIKRRGLGIRSFVSHLEQSVIDLLATFNIQAQAKCQAPGVYVNEQKICSIGLRVRKGCAYHGMAFNISMDLTPFQHINPCGFSALQMTQLSVLGGFENVQEAGRNLIKYLMKNLGYTSAEYVGFLSER